MRQPSTAVFMSSAPRHPSNTTPQTGPLRAGTDVESVVPVSGRRPSQIRAATDSATTDDLDALIFHWSRSGRAAHLAGCPSLRGGWRAGTWLDAVWALRRPCPKCTGKLHGRLADLFADALVAALTRQRVTLALPVEMTHVDIHMEAARTRARVFDA